MADGDSGAVSIRNLGADDSVDRWKDYRSILPPQEYDESSLLDLVTDDSFAAAPADRTCFDTACVVFAVDCSFASLTAGLRCAHMSHVLPNQSIAIHHPR